MIAPAIARPLRTSASRSSRVEADLRAQAREQRDVQRDVHGHGADRTAADDDRHGPVDGKRFRPSREHLPARGDDVVGDRSGARSRARSRAARARWSAAEPASVPARLEASATERAKTADADRPSDSSRRSALRVSLLPTPVAASHASASSGNNATSTSNAANRAREGACENDRPASASSLTQLIPLST